MARTPSPPRLTLIRPDAFDWARVHWRPKAFPVTKETCSYCGQPLADAEHITSRLTAPDGSARMAVFCARCLHTYWDDLMVPRFVGPR